MGHPEGVNPPVLLGWPCWWWSKSQGGRETPQQWKKQLGENGAGNSAPPPPPPLPPGCRWARVGQGVGLELRTWSWHTVLMHIPPTCWEMPEPQAYIWASPHNPMKSQLLLPSFFQRKKSELYGVKWLTQNEPAPNLANWENNPCLEEVPWGLNRERERGCGVLSLSRLTNHEFPFFQSILWTEWARQEEADLSIRK